MGTAVGDSKPGITPIRLQNRIKAQGRQEWRVALAVVADDLVALALDESLDTFESVLQRARAIHRKSRADQNEHDQKKRKTRTSIAKEFVMGAVGYLGGTCKACSSAVTGPPNR